MSVTALKVSIDADSFTLGEYADLCDAAGINPAEAADGKVRVTMQMVPALYFVLRRRTQPDFTLDDARASSMAVLTSEMPALLAEASRPDPTGRKSVSKPPRTSSRTTPATRSAASKS